ncbi:uncharacterized protein RHTO_05764 [Rhodotorula toruloides NP11]|nr:uncharacterized protein RHTO_05764 [Rhodotorula toruloides NP11]EMS18661.1 hypothetical protein RHTO_05764 [Rhodotorula toruloides NP11]
MLRSAPPLPRELLRSIFLQELYDERGPDWAEFNGKRFSLVCRDGAAPGQELTFYRPVLDYGLSFRWNRPENPLQQFAKHLARFPHIAHLVRDLRLECINDKAETKEALRTILQRCDRITEICLPLAELTVLQIGNSERWDFSVLLRALPLCVKLRSLALSVALPGDPPSSFAASAVVPLSLRTLLLQRTHRREFASVRAEAYFYGQIPRYACPKALTTLSISLHAQNFETLLRWVKQCSSLQDLEFCIVDADPTDFVEKQTKSDMWEAENDRCRTGLGELAAHLSHFLDTLPPTLVELEAAFWAPAGDCNDLVKTFLRSRSHDSPLRRVIFDAEVKKFGRVRLKATKSHEWIEQGVESKTDWNLTYKHWAGCSCGDWDYGSWTLDGPDAAEYEVSDPSVELEW